MPGGQGYQGNQHVMSGGAGGAGGAHDEANGQGGQTYNSLTGGAGANGDNGTDVVADGTLVAGSGGGGGAGGYALIVTGGGIVTIGDQAIITGGKGGDGGNGGMDFGTNETSDGGAGFGGSGGGGGLGIWMKVPGITTFNQAQIIGGVGGKGGISPTTPGTKYGGIGTGNGGAGGAAIYGADAGGTMALIGSILTNDVSGRITGGAGGDGGDTGTQFPDLGEPGHGSNDMWGANGGAGGAGVYGVTIVTNGTGATISGGAGGNAGTGDQFTAFDLEIHNEAKGGAGGAGVVALMDANNTPATVNNEGSITGGTGGHGGDALTTGPDTTYQSVGGAGGNGIESNGATIINATVGTIKGGAGGAGGIAHATDVSNGNGGNGGDGINGSNLRVVNSATIEGGNGGTKGANGSGTAAAGKNGYGVHFTGGTNTLEIRQGSNIVGGVFVDDGTVNNTFILGGAGDDAFNGILSTKIDGTGDYQGFDTFEKSGSSNWTLTKISDVSWTIKEGTLTIGDGGGLGAAGTSVNTGPSASEKGILAFHQSAGSTEVDTTITGKGKVVQNGQNTVKLGAANTYEGGTDLNAGVISVAEDDSLGVATSDLNFNGGTLQITDTGMQSTAHTINWGGNGGGFDIDDVGNKFIISQDLTGAGTLTKDGAGTLALTGLNAYTGMIAIEEGTLQIGDGSTVGELGAASSVTVAAGASLAFDRTDGTLVVNQTISGDGGVTQKGTGKTTLTGTNNYIGMTDIQAGALQLGQNTTAGSLASQSTVNIAQDAKFIISHNDASFDFTNLIQGDGQVVIDGDGTVALTNMGNTYTGGTELDKGVLKLYSDKVLGSGDLIMNGGTLLPDSAVVVGHDVQVLGTGSVFQTNTLKDLTLTGKLTGDAGTAFTKTGNGRLILNQSANASGFAGAANVNEGALVVNSNQFGGSVIVNSGGTLAGAGTVGNTNVVAGGKLAGMVGTTLTINGNLTVDANSTVDVNIGATTFNQEMFNVTGNLTLNGKLDVSTSGGAAPGIYRIFNYDPSQTNAYSTFQLGTIDGAAANSADWKIEDTNPGQINLVNMQGMSFVVWDGSNTNDGGGVHGGDGTWNIADTNWKDIQSQSINDPWADGSVAVFRAAAGTITIDDQAGSVNAAGLVFETDNYHINGRPLNLVQGANGTAPFIQVGAGSDPAVTATIDTVLQGSAGLTKTGVGTLILTKDTTYSGTTTVTAGTLQLGDGGHEGGVDTDVELNGSLLADTALVFNRSDGFHFQHSISGNGEVIQRGTGTTVFAASNSFSGGLTVEIGTAQAGIADTAFGAGRVAVEKGATLNLAGFNQTIGGLVGNKDDKGDGEIQLGSGILTLNQDFNTDFSGKISGTGGLVKNENAKLTLSGTNDYSGVTTVNGGSLVQGAQNAFSKMSAYTVADGATLDLGGFATGMQSLENGGTVDFGGIGGTTLNIAGDYAGGGTLVMSTVLGADNSTTDQMKVGGNTFGTTSVVVKNRGGLGAATVNGIELIDIAGNSGGKFYLQGDYTTKDGQPAILTSSAYAYTLQKGDASGSNTNDWYLVSQYTRSNPDGPNPPACDDPNGCPGNPSNPSGPSRFSPAAPVYTSYAASMQALNQLPTLQQRRGDRYLNKSGSLRGSSEAGETDDRAIWARIEGAHNRLEPNTTAGHVQQDINTVIMHAGVDGQFYEDESGRLIAGITGQYGNGRARTASNFDDVNGGGELNTQGWGLGGTVTWYGNDGFYVDGQAQANWYKTDLRFGGGNNGLTNDNNGFGYAFSVETGKRFDIDENWSLTPQAQLIFSSVDFDTFSDSYGATVSNRDGNSLNGRLGLAANYANSWQGADSRMVNANVYGIANLYQEFLGGTSINYGGTRMKADQDRTWAGVGFGGTYAWADNKYSVYGEGTVNTSLNHFADSYAVKGNVGFKVNW